MRKGVLLAAMVLLAIGCSSTNKSLVWAKSAPQGEEGMRVELDAGTFSGGAVGKLENVGEFMRIPSTYRGAVPEGWTVYDGAIPPPEPEEDDEERPDHSPPPVGG